MEIKFEQPALLNPGWVKKLQFQSEQTDTRLSLPKKCILLWDTVGQRETQVIQ